MTRRAWLNLVLLLMVILLASLAYFEPGGEKAETPDTLLVLPQSQVTRIQIQARDAGDIQLERSPGGGWMIVAPIRVDASDYRVNNMLQLLSATSYTHFPVSERPLSEFGLDHPAGKVMFNEKVVEFGDIEPLNNHRYVRVGEQIHLIDDRYFYQSQLMLTALVDTALVPAGRALKKIHVPGLMVQQQQGQWRGQWQASASRTATVEPSRVAVAALVDAWRQARAMQIDHYQADQAEAVIELEYSDGSREQLDILAHEPELILGRQALDLRYHLSADQGERLLTLSDSEATDGAESAASDDTD